MAASEEGYVKRRISECFQPSAASNFPLVHVYIGPERKLFIFPEALLCDRFKFFRSAFQSGFRESVEKAIDLPEDDPVAFSYVIDRAFKDYTAMEDRVATEEVQLALAKVYVLADKLGRPDLAREAQAEYCNLLYHSQSFSDQPICPRTVRYVYENTSESATLRHTLVYMIVEKYNRKSCFTAEWMQKWSESATSHPQFHFDIMLKHKNAGVLMEADHEIDCKSPSCIVHSS